MRRGRGMVGDASLFAFENERRVEVPSGGVEVSLES